MRSAEEKVRSEAERHSRCTEKHERKNAERLERAKKRCDQIRQIIGSTMGVFDPANLSIGSENPCNAGASTSSNASQVPPAVSPAVDVYPPTPELIRLVSNTILQGCLQPANLINKILTEIMGMVPPAPAENEAQASAQASNDQQQQTEFPRQNTATNTSDVNTPTAADLSSDEIKALFKEAAKELEKMNEIANSSKTMESSTISGGSSNSVVTQIERVAQDLTDSVFSNSTIINIDPPKYTEFDTQAVTVDGRAKSPDIEESYKIVTPPKSILRSRESSIEVHDVNSMMSDDSRDWTMLDASTNENDEEVSFVSAHFNPSLPGAASFNTSEAASDADKNNESIKSTSAETQTLSSLNGANSDIPFREEVLASIQKSIETVGEMSELVKNSIDSARQSLNLQPVVVIEPFEYPSSPAVAPQVTPSAQIINSEREATSVASQATPIAASVAAQATPVASSVASQSSDSAPSAPPVAASRQISTPQLSATTQANLMANRMATGVRSKNSQVGPAVVVYDPNPKVNAAVHTMLAMGFSNDGKWQRFFQW